jgi:deoxyribonuclease IV
MKIGCHVSIAGGVHNAPERAANLGCEVFQMFTRSPQGGKVAPITLETIKNFEEQKLKHDLPEFVVHTPYFINFGSAAKNIYYGSVSVLKDELERANMLGARFVMTHLGSYKDTGQEAGAEQVIKALTNILEDYQGKTKLLLEIAAGSGEVIGSTIDELALFSKELLKFKGFGGICFDTQHAFASGYDISNPAGLESTFREFDEKVNLEHLRMSHLNDSKIELAGKKDRHDHIGAGHIGEKGFLNFFRFWMELEQKYDDHRPLILETDHDKVKEDILLAKQLRSEAERI